MNKENLIPITEDEADKLMKLGVATMFDCYCDICKPRIENNCDNCDARGTAPMGFFSAREGARTDIILVINNDGSFIRAAEDLVRSNDGVFVNFVDDGKPSEFEDVFTIKEY